jgi:hypothetical protein
MSVAICQIAWRHIAEGNRLDLLSDCRENLTSRMVSNKILYDEKDHHCGQVVRVPGYRSRGPGSIPDATRYAVK